MKISPEIESLLEKLEEKYARDEQGLEGFLEGLLYNRYVDYWDYIQQDALLNLQNPRTNIPDEQVFIIYHQVTELFFKLSLHELQQIRESGENRDSGFIETKIKRVVNYFQALTSSFSIMVEGMEPKQFLQFRMSLLPASGFQSVQYRLIELACTPLINLVHEKKRESLKNAKINEQYHSIYWKRGATIAATGKKTLTLKRFEQHYDEKLIEWAKDRKTDNLWNLFDSMPESEKTDGLIKQMKNLDKFINVNWPMVHYRSAVRYLKGDPDKVGTGGTNWEKYLPPKIQQRVFFPDLWSNEELENWGK